jgi:hypothetical protein
MPPSAFFQAFEGVSLAKFSHENDPVSRKPSRTGIFHPRTVKTPGIDLNLFAQ